MQARSTEWPIKLMRDPGGAQMVAMMSVPGANRLLTFLRLLPTVQPARILIEEGKENDGAYAEAGKMPSPWLEAPNEAKSRIAEIVVSLEPNTPIQPP